MNYIDKTGILMPINVHQVREQLRRVAPKAIFKKPDHPTEIVRLWRAFLSSENIKDIKISTPV